MENAVREGVCIDRILIILSGTDETIEEFLHCLNQLRGFFLSLFLRILIFLRSLFPGLPESFEEQLLRALSGGGAALA